VQPRGRRLRIVPSGLSDVFVRREALRGHTVRSKRVRTLRGLRGPRTISAKGLRAGTYVLDFRSGGDRRRRVVAVRGGRFRKAPQRLDAVRSCARAALSQALFDGRGLRVVVVPTDPKAKVDIRALRAGKHRGKPVKPDRVVRTSLVRARLLLGRGTWRVTVTVAGRRIGTLVAQRPR
jgi:hypothetical protein